MRPARVTANECRRTAARKIMLSSCRTRMLRGQWKLYRPLRSGARANVAWPDQPPSPLVKSRKAAREFKHRVKAGMVGINIGVPATMAMFPFTGWDESFYGDLHIQGKEGVQFYTQQKVVSTRWFGDGVGDVWKK